MSGGCFHRQLAYGSVDGVEKTYPECGLGAWREGKPEGEPKGSFSAAVAWMPDSKFSALEHSSPRGFWPSASIWGCTIVSS
jgi:hypothetical protein